MGAVVMKERFTYPLNLNVHKIWEDIKENFLRSKPSSCRRIHDRWYPGEADDEEFFVDLRWELREVPKSDLGCIQLQEKI